MLDESFSGVLVSDFYAAYHHYPGLKQRCWVHLLRDIHDLKILYPKDPAAAQGNLCRRIERHIKELFVFVAAPGVPSDNNAAERSLRPLVVSRKISGGTRSGQGTDTKMTLASLFGTWRAQGLNTLLTCRQLLSSPQL